MGHNCFDVGLCYTGHNCYVVGRCHVGINHDHVTCRIDYYSIYHYCKDQKKD